MGLEFVYRCTCDWCACVLDCVDGFYFYGRLCESIYIVIYTHIYIMCIGNIHIDIEFLCT